MTLTKPKYWIGRILFFTVPSHQNLSIDNDVFKAQSCVAKRFNKIRGD